MNAAASDMAFDGQPRGDRYKWWLLAFLFVTYFLEQGARQVYNATLPQIKVDFTAFGVTNTELGVVGTVFGAVFGISLVGSGKRGGSGRARFRMVDWDGDGRTDILQAAFNARLVKNIRERDGRHIFRYLKKVGVEQLQGHTCCPTTVDFNADGIPDLVIAAEDGYFYYMKNPGSRSKGENGK